MKKTVFAALALSCFYLFGCSLPGAAKYNQLYSITKEEKKAKGGFGSNKKEVSIKDFRGNRMYEEDMDALGEKAQGYILAHPDLTDSAKNNLRQLKIGEGSTKEEVKLLLGKPDKVAKASNNACQACEIWIYRLNKINAFTIFIFPVFFAHEGYYLYFKDSALAAIERHYLEEMIHQGSAPGVALGGVSPKK